MKHLDLSPVRQTSVTMRTAIRLSLRQASGLLRQRGLQFSGQRLMSECLRIALKLWRGHKEMARRNKRYNSRTGPYEIVPFYTSEALRSVAWARCHHAGISLSRLLDFAVACYLQRVIEYWLRFEYRGRDRADAARWRSQYDRRLHRADFIISYEGLTVENSMKVLSFSEKTSILPWPPPNTPPNFAEGLPKTA